MKIIYALYRNRNGEKYDHSNEDFCKKSSSHERRLEVLMRVAICFEYSPRPEHLKICVQKFIKAVV